MKFGIGQAVRRSEDPRFLTGRGRFVEDAARHGTLHAAVVRSERAHARIRGLDTDAAKRMPGVHAVLTAADYAADGLGGIACRTLFPWLHKSVATRPVPALAGDTVRYAGAPVALVVAESRALARDAAEMVEIDFEDLPAVTDTAAALAEGAHQLWPHAPGNRAFEIALGDAAGTEAALAAAAHVTNLTLHNNRVSANALEMRAALADIDPRDGRLTLVASTQSPHTLRAEVAEALGLPHGALRVVARDVGGGFGMKGAVYAEDILVAWAAKRLGRPVLWQASRSDSLISDYHGRDQQVTAELALDTEGRITALRVRGDFNTGAFLTPGAGVPPMFATTLATGCYRVPVADVRMRAVYTNTSPVQPYRGAGRPEASYLIERLIDAAARETGRDRVALRQLNMLSAGEMPYKTPLAYTIDSGDYAAVLDRALELSDHAAADTRKAEARARGRLHGVGIALHMENAGLANEAAEIRFDPDGRAAVLAGTFSHGQGHETAYAQMVSDWLGVPFDHVRVIQGDTDAVAFGRGTVASRSMLNGGASLRLAADIVIDKARTIAAHLMEVSPDDVVFDAGQLTVAGTDKHMPIQEVAAMAFKPVLPPDMGLGLAGEGQFKLEGFSFPNGCQIAEVEIDPETGQTFPIRIVSVDDVGTVINPLLLDGQLMGGIAQGLGQALMEDVVYDADGQLMTGSFMDYAMPRAADIPPIEIDTLPTPTASNPLGVKGAGEAGTVGATPALVLAVLDALAPLGVTDIAMPATPLRVWQAIQAARSPAE
ncbi:MAG: xanthine dehydrogenase family protein molybdopterin-binding subunit [Rhodobacter sp.]|nr:xanthine dehydrogenase family protein molybdopterin-binding subunit [Rhodobacter sp.]